MYEYKYRRIETGGGFWFDNIQAVHRSAIDEEAQNGWRYVGCIPTKFTRYGVVRSMDLIFERPAEK